MMAAYPYPNNNNETSADVDNIDVNINCNCRFCCDHVNDIDLQYEYATKYADTTSRSHKTAKAFEWLLLIAVVAEFIIAIACFIFGVYLDYLRNEMSVLSLADQDATTQQQIQSNRIITILANVPAFLITMGVLMVVFVIIGELGALRHYLPFLGIYLGFLVAITLCQLIIVCAFADNKELLARTIRDEFSTNGIKNYYDDADLKYVIDYVQVHFTCCGSGSGGYTEWNNNMYFNCTTSNPAVQRCSVPASCCRNASVESGSSTVNIINNYCGLGVLATSAKNVETRIYTQGCFEPVMEWLSSYEYVIVLLVGLIAIAPLFEEACIAFLIHVIRQERRKFEIWKATGHVPPEEDDDNTNCACCVPTSNDNNNEAYYSSNNNNDPSNNNNNGYYYYNGHNNNVDVIR